MEPKETRRGEGATSTASNICPHDFPKRQQTTPQYPKVNPKFRAPFTEGACTMSKFIWGIRHETVSHGEKPNE